MKEFLGLFVMCALTGFIAYSCGRDSFDKGEVYHRIDEVKTKLEFQDSCVAEHLDSIRARIKASTDTALYDSVIDDLDGALYQVQDGDEVWVDLDAIQNELL